MNSLALHLSAELGWMNDSKQKLWTKHTELSATGQLKILVVVIFCLFFRRNHFHWFNTNFNSKKSNWTEIDPIGHFLSH